MNLTTTRHRAPDLRALVAATLLALLAAFALCAVPTAHAHAEDPIEIWTASDLANVKNDRSGSYILMADIDLAGGEWTPLGSPSNYNDSSGSGFKGTFDGNRHTIKNVSISSFSTNNGIQYAGFFGATKGATIKNLTLENVTIKGTYSGGAAHDLMVGALVGLAVNTNISGCNVVNASVADTFAGDRSDTNNYAIGGLVGDFYADGLNGLSLANCSVANASVQASATFTGAVNSVQSFTGGLVGRLRERNSAKVSFSNCVFDGDVYGAGYVGPFIGGARIGDDPKAAKISKDAADRSVNSFYSGTITGPAGHPDESYNCGEGVWDEDWNYKKDEALVTDENRAAALSKLGSGWRIAVLYDGRAALVVDHRNAYVSALSLDHGQATLTGTLSGYFNDSEKGSAVLSWSTGGASGSGPTFSIPVTSESQTVTLQLSDGGSVQSTTTTEVEAGSIELYLTKTRDGKTGDVTTITAEVVSSYGGFATDDLDFVWYGIAGEVATELQRGGASLERGRFGDYEEFKVIAEARQSSSIAAEAVVNIIGRTVYLSIGGDNAENRGFSPDVPVRTFARAYELLDKNGTRETNVIVVMDQYTNTDFGYDDTTFNKPATVTSYDADLNVDYRDPNNGGAYLSFHNDNRGNPENKDGTLISGKLLFADTTFKDITLSAKGAESSFNIGYIYCQGNSLTMDTGVRMEGYRRATATGVSGYGLLAGTSANDFNIVGGFANYDEPPEKGWDGGTCEIVLRSGSYSRVIAGGRNFEVGNNNSVNKTSHNQFGTEDKPFNVSITVDIDASQSQKGTGGNTCDIGQLTGGQTDGTIYCNSVITLKNGVVPQLFGSSIGYNRDVNPDGTTSYPNNDFVGTTTVNMEGGSVAQLYGGCLGRATDSKSTVVVDARFRSSKNTPTDQADIAINISGGSVGKIDDIDAPMTGVFAAGAGGITGAGNPTTGEVTNLVDVVVNISDGTISGNLYGGGYGHSSAVTVAKLACLEAGNLYGSSTVNITGGTINADVYGGGAGTGAHLAGNDRTNALAQIVGDVKLSISGAEINGSVYGGSQGIVQSGYDCTSMAKITGNVELSIENAHITGSVYGGSALGAVTGNVATTLNGGGSTIEGSVYGAGKGQIVSDYDLDKQQAVGLVSGDASLDISGYSIGANVFGGGSVGAVLGSGGVATSLNGANVAGSVYGAGEGAYLKENSDIALQKAIGWVKGDASLAVVNGSNVGGDVFGGGNLGVVGDGALSTGTVPYSIADPSNVSVLIENANVQGSVFGGGSGNVSTSGQMPRLLGAVFGTASVTVHEGSINMDVFGGGYQSYSYAPLDKDGNPERAATVVVNGGDSLYVHADDGRVAGGPGEGVREIDAVPGDAPKARAINLGGSVFGGGNIADSHRVSATYYTMYGDTEVFIKGSSVEFTNDKRGGVYGDGNLSQVHGERTVTLVGLRTQREDRKQADKSFFSLQRANRVVVHDCSIYLRGAKDLVNERDQTPYSLNRVDNLNVYADSTIQFDTVVNGLGNLYSDVLPERTFTSDWNGLGVGEFGDNVDYEEKSNYQTFVNGWNKGSWTDAKGGEHSTANTLIVNNGKWLDVKQASDTGDAAYGSVTGLFSLLSSNASSGGAFVFGRNMPDSTGTFISLNSEQSPWGPGPFLDLYTQSTVDGDGKPCRVWFIKGESYTYDREIRAYTTGSTATIQVLLPVEYPVDEKTGIRLADGSVISIGSGLVNMQKSATKTDGDSFSASMVLGEGAAASKELPFYEGANTQWQYDFGSYVKPNEGPALLPATITIELDADQEEPAAQSGIVEFTLVTDNFAEYHFKINIVLERAYAVATEKAHYGRVYNNIAVENVTPITPTSSYTTQFTTTYSPGAYRSEVKASLSASTSWDIHNDDHSGWFPKGTKITMVNITDPSRPAYYYYECTSELSTIPLTEFVSMADDTQHYKNPKGNTVIVEDLLFVVDYSEANKVLGEALGHESGLTYIALNHTYDSGGVEKDILRYTRVNEDGEPEERFNNLWNAYEISTTADAVYAPMQLRHPDSAAYEGVKVGHTDNFMYDTYATKLKVDVASNCVSTLFDENEVALQVSLGQTADGKAKAIPLGTKLVVKNARGEEVETRYLHTDGAVGAGYLMASLGDTLDSEYVIELHVPRYIEGSGLDSVLAGSSHTLFVDVFVSPDGLYRWTENDPYARLSLEFSAARDAGSDSPAYELGNKYKGDFLKAENGQVKGSDKDGEIVLGKGNRNENADAEMTVLRRPAGSSDAAVDIVELGGSVTKGSRGDNIVFAVVDTPAVSGTYEYEIRIGNTVYFQTVAVP